MGKQNTTPTPLSEKEYNSKLNEEIGLLIDKGFSDDDIKLYGENFKSKYVISEDSQPKQEVADPLKKKGSTNTTSVSELSELGSSQQKEVGVSEQPTSNNQPAATEQKVQGKSSPLDFNPIVFGEGFVEDNVAKQYNDLLSNTSEETKNNYLNFISLRDLTQQDQVAIDQKEKSLSVKITPENKRKELGLLETIAQDFKSFSFSKMFGGDENFKKEQEKQTTRINEERKDRVDSGSLYNDITAKKQKEFLENLNNPEERKKVEQLVQLEQQFNQNIIFKANSSIEKANTDIDAIDTNIESLSKGLEVINKEVENNPNISQEEYQSKLAEFENKSSLLQQEIDSRNTIATQAKSELDQALQSEAAIGSFEEEKNLLKKSYAIDIQTSEKLKTGFAQLFSNLEFQRERLHVAAGSYGFEQQERSDALDRVTKEALERTQVIEKYRENTILEGVSGTDIESVSDAGEFAFNAFTDTLPTLIQMAVPYVGVASFIASQQADTELSFRQRTLDNVEELKEVNTALNNPNTEISKRPTLNKRKAQLESIKKPSETEIFLTSVGLATAEALLGKIGKIRLLGKLKRVALTATKQELRLSVQKSLFTRVRKGAFEFGKDTSGEVLEESGIQLANNIVDIHVFGEKFNKDGTEKNILDGTYEAGLGGFAVGGALSGSTTIIGTLGREIADKKSRNTIVANVKESNELLANIDATSKSILRSAEDKAIIIKGYEKRLAEINQQNFSIINKNIDAYNNLTPKGRRRVAQISNEASAIEFTVTKIENQKELDEADKKAVFSLKERLTNLDAEKQDLLVSAEVKTTIKSVDGETVLSDNKSLYEKLADDDFIKSVADGETKIEIKNNQEAANLLTERLKDFNEEQKPSVLKTAEAISDNVEDLGDVMGGGAVSIKEGGSSLIITENAENINVESISTEKGQQGQGSARSLMTKLTNEADKQNKTVELKVVPLNTDTSPEQLVTFYESLGFVKEDGFELDGGKMVRQPQESTTTEIAQETTPQQQPIDRVGETNDTYFDELENEEDSISRLEGEIDPNKDRNAEIERIAEEHTESYKAYLEENNELDKLEDTDFVQTFKDNAVKALSNPNTVEDNQTQTQEDGVRVDENGNPITEEEFLLEQEKVEPNEIIDEAAPQADTTPNADVRPTTEPSQQQRQDNAVQPTVELTANTAEVTKNPIVRKKFGNEVLDVELNNGEVVVTNSFNKDKKVSRKNKKAAIKEYIAQNNFDNQQYTETQSSDTSLNSREISDESTNPSEVALQIQVQEQAEQDGTISTDQVSNEAKQNAIAETFKNFRFKKVDLANGTKGYEVVDLSQGYKGGNKETATMGTIIEEAQRALDSNTSQETDAMSVQATGFDGSDRVVSEDDIRDFVNDFTSGSDYLNQAKKEQNTESSEVQSLKEKFTELTGLEATSDNIDAVSNTSNNEQAPQEQAPQEDVSEDIEDDGLPFQTNDPNKIDADPIISKEELREQLQQLIPSGLAEQVVILNGDAATDAKLAEIGVNKAQTQSASNNGVTITPNGFVHNGIVYLNSDKVKADTAVHEFGHLWNSYMKENHKEVFDTGVKLMEGTTYLEDVENNTAYDHLSEEGKKEEALAQAIGDKGAKILGEAKKKSFANWFNVLFKRIANGIRLSNIQPTRLANLNLKQFTDLAAAEILAGKNITGRDTKAIKDARTRKDVAPSSSIQSVIEKEEAVNNAKQKVVDAYETKQKTEDGVKKALQDYIDESLSAAQATEAKKPELKRLVDIVANAKTDTNYLRAIESIDKIIEKLDEKYNTSKTEAQKVRDEAKKAARDSKTDAKKRKKVIQDYLSKVVDKKFLSDINFNDIKSIQNLIDNSTNENMSETISKIDDLAVKLETKYNERTSRNEQKLREAKEKIRDKKANIKEVQKIVLAYINDAIDNNFMGNATPSETKRLIKKAKFEGRQTGTDAQKRTALKKVLDEVIDIDLGVKNKGLRKKFLKELTTGRSKNQSGRLKVGTVDYFSTETIMVAIENYINGKVDFLNSKDKTSSNSKALSTEAELLSKKEKEINDIIEILDERTDSILYEESVNEKGETVLTPKKTLTDEESQVLNSLNIAKAFLNSQIKGNKYANRLLNNAVSYIIELKAEGRSILKAEKEADKAELNEQLEQSIKANDVKNARQDERFNRPLSNIRDNVSKSQSELKKVRGFIRKYSNSVYRNFFSIAEELKRSGIGKTILEGSDRVLKEYDLAENTRDLTILNWEKEVTDIKVDVFGSMTDSRFNFIKKAANFLTRSKVKRSKSDWALSEQFEIDRDYGDGTTDIYSASASTLLDVLLKAKDPQNLDKLAKQGLDEKAIKQIESLLSDEVKEYGERILEFYQDKYIAVNEVYKKMFYRDMPFSQFYSGKLNVDNDNANQNPSQDLLSGMLSSGSVHSGSSKARKANNYAIQPQPVDASLNQYISEMSRFIAYAEVDKRFNNIFNNADFEKVVLLNNGIEGGVMIKYLRDFQRSEIYEDGKRGAFDRVVNQITGNLTKFTLSGKLFNLPIQMMSATSGQSSLPNNLSAKEWIDAHKNIISEAAYVFKNSKLLQLRYSGEQMVKVLSSVDTNRQLQDFKVPLINDRTKLVFDIMSEVYEQANNLGLSFIKGGDAFGVLGVVPVFTANKNRIRKENPNLTDQQVIDEAMLIFESIANEIQQPQTKGGKTAVQRDTYARLLVSFGSTVILDMRNASLRYRDIKRHIKSKATNNQTLGDVMRKLNFDVDEYKNVKPSNTLSKDIRGFIEFGFRQPLLYATWGIIKVTGSIAAVGGAFQVLGALLDDEDDEEQLKQFSDEDKDLARVALTGQILDDAVLGSAFKYYLDKEILQKEFTFGGVGNIFVVSETQKLQKYYESARNAKTEATKQKYNKLLTSQMAGMGLGIAKHGMLIALFNKELNSNESYGFTAGEKARIYAGASFFSIDNVREERTGVSLQTILEDSISNDDNIEGASNRPARQTRRRRPNR